jgi:hypothetical protein
MARRKASWNNHEFQSESPATMERVEQKENSNSNHKSIHQSIADIDKMFDSGELNQEQYVFELNKLYIYKFLMNDSKLSESDLSADDKLKPWCAYQIVHGEAGKKERRRAILMSLPR